MLGFILHLIKIMPISDGMFHSVIDPLTIGLAIGGVKTLAGGIQALTAGPKVEQKPYERPKEFDLFAQRAEEQGRQGLPRQTFLETQQAAQQAAIFGMRAAQDRRGGLAYAPISQTLLNRANLNLAVQDAAARQRNFVQQQQALLTLGAQKNLEFQTESQRRQNLELQRRARVGAGLQNIMGGLDIAGSMAAMGALGGRGGLGSGSRPGFGGSTYNPNSSLLSGTAAPIFSGTYTPSAASMSLTGMRSPFSSFSLRNANIPGSSNQSNYTPTANLPGYGAAMEDLFSNP